MSVEDIVVRAGLSRRTFYDHFKGGKEDAFLAAYDDAIDDLMAEVQAAYDRSRGFTDRVREALAAFLEFFAQRPADADMCIVEVMAAGYEAINRRNGTMHHLADLILQAAEDELPKRGRPPEFIAETLVGGTYEVVYTRVLRGMASELPGLLPDLVFAVLLPYLGLDAAAAERRRLNRRSGRRP